MTTSMNKPCSVTNTMTKPMPLDRYLASALFLYFQDVILRQNAYEKVEEFLENNRPIKKAQLYSLPAVIQAGGLSGLLYLAKNQKSKNTNEGNKAKEDNKKFWEFVFDLLAPLPGSASSYYGLVQNELRNQDLLQDEEKVTEKVLQKQIKKANKKQVEAVMEHALPVYFEHFNCHYFYQTR